MWRDLYHVLPTALVMTGHIVSVLDVDLVIFIPAFGKLILSTTVVD